MAGAIMPYQLSEVVGKKLTRDLLAGEAVKWTFLAEPNPESGAKAGA
jgi:hypothetical protein